VDNPDPVGPFLKLMGVARISTRRNDSRATSDQYRQPVQSSPKLAVCIAAGYQNFFDEHNSGDCVTSRPTWRIILWVKASENDLEIW
jgi:hypothetical protein